MQPDTSGASYNSRRSTMKNWSVANGTHHIGVGETSRSGNFQEVPIVAGIPSRDTGDTLKAVPNVSVHPKRVARLGNSRVIWLNIQTHFEDYISKSFIMPRSTCVYWVLPKRHLMKSYKRYSNVDSATSHVVSHVKSTGSVKEDNFHLLWKWMQLNQHLYMATLDTLTNRFPSDKLFHCSPLNCDTFSSTNKTPIVQEQSNLQSKLSSIQNSLLYTHWSYVFLFWLLLSSFDCTHNVTQMNEWEACRQVTWKKKTSFELRSKWGKRFASNTHSWRKRVPNIRCRWTECAWTSGYRDWRLNK